MHRPCSQPWKGAVMPSFGWTRINNDVNGNGRWVCHYLAIASTIEEAIAIAKRQGGKRYRGKRYGGGIVFQSSANGGCLPALEAALREGGER
jgi:hypothetical protein